MVPKKNIALTEAFCVHEVSKNNSTSFNETLESIPGNYDRSDNKSKTGTQNLQQKFQV